MTRIKMVPPSPNGSVYDLSDDEEDEYNTIMHSSSGRGVKLLFSKSKVYVHPTPSSKDNIAGFIALIQQKPSASAADASPAISGSEATVRPSTSASIASTASANAASYLLSWVPEVGLGSLKDSYNRVESTGASSPPRRSTLVPAPPTSSARDNTIGYAFSVPLSEVYSLFIRPPSVGWWYGSLVINTKSGDSFPALFFHDDECESTILQKKKMIKETFDPFGDSGAFWGGDEVLRWLRKYVKVERSGAEHSIYLVNPSPEDLLGFSEPSTPAAIGSGKKPEAAKDITPSQPAQNAAPSGVSASRDNEAGMDAFTRALKQARWGFLEKMSQVTTFTRRTAQDVLENPKVPPQVKRLMRNPEVQTLQDEFDSARVYLARWAMGIAEQGERDRNTRMWTARDVLDLEDGELGEFEILDVENLNLSNKRKPVTAKEWDDFFDPVTGRLRVTPDEVKQRIFHGGFDPSDGVRKEAWLFLLGVYEWDSTSEERSAMIASKRDEYVRLKGGWWERMIEGHDSRETAEWWREQRNRIEKDVHRTDRHLPLFEGEDIPHPDPDSPFADVGTNVHLEQMKDMLLTYNEYNKDLGYVQGMSDLLAPIYAVQQDDAVAFWAFVNFMDRMERNFLRDQSGMRTQLITLDQLVALMDPKLYQHLQKADSTNFFFFFRMLLVWYKREFEWADVLRLWEGLWTDYLSSNFHLFFALAILEKHRDVIMMHLQHFDEVLKYVNELSGTIDLESTLRRAEALFYRFQKTVDAIDKQNNFPEAPVRQRRPASGAQAPSQGLSSGIDARTPAEMQRQKNQPLSPELRDLLSRKPPTMDKKEVRAHGGGVGTGV